MDKYLKWVATGFLMIGAALNSLNIYPWGPIANLFGGGYLNQAKAIIRQIIYVTKA